MTRLWKYPMHKLAMDSRRITALESALSGKGGSDEAEGSSSDSGSGNDSGCGGSAAAPEQEGVERADQSREEGVSREATTAESGTEGRTLVTPSDMEVAERKVEALRRSCAESCEGWCAHSGRNRPNPARARRGPMSDHARVEPPKERGIEIRPSKTADTRTCDYTAVSKKQLLDSSVQHIGDVRRALAFFQQAIGEAATRHDEDKLTDIDGFHRDFVGGFIETTWWDAHRKLNRHHLNAADGVPGDVNLIDVLDFIADCVMAGMARSGSVRPLDISSDVLMRAFTNTAELLAAQVHVLAPDETP